MKKLLTCMVTLCISIHLYAQKDEIVEFQRQNPDIEFISQDRYNSLSAEEIDLISGRYIVFHQAIEESDLTPFSQELILKSTQSVPVIYTEMSDKQKNLVKMWLANHPEVKIVKKSEFEALTEEDKLVYIGNHCLILISETLTFMDIELYPY